MRQHVATVRFEAEDRTSQSGRPYSSVAVAIDGQQELTRLFGPPGHAPFQGLRRGQQVAIAVDSQGKAHLLENAPQPMGFTAPAASPQPVPQVQQQAPAAYGAQPQPPAAPAAPADPVTALALQWAQAFRTLTQAGVPVEAAGPGASCVLIQACGRR